MRIIIVLSVFSLALLMCLVGTKAQPSCNPVCTREFNPLCGTLRVSNGRIIQCTFANPCLLRLRMCQTRERWTSIRGRCRRESIECVGIKRSI